MSLLFINPSLLLAMPGGTEWLLILLVILLFFGGRKIPELMKGIGKGVKEFNDAKDSMKDDIKAGTKQKDELPRTENSDAVENTK
jgi:sec-independent protein translocase protein TatA